MDNGEIVYAVPSHQETAIKLACKKHGITRDELNAMCPREYYTDFLNWLLMQSGAIAVWDGFYIGNANNEQTKSLQMLKSKKLYTGAIL